MRNLLILNRMEGRMEGWMEGKKDGRKKVLLLFCGDR